MKRRLLNLLTILSLLLCMAVVALWMFRIEGIHVLRDGGGGIGGGSYVATYVLFVHNGRIGLGWTHSDVWFEGEVASPLWVVALVTAAVPATWVVRRARRRTDPEPGLCPRCGYDLRAPPGRCPECGASVIHSGARFESAGHPPYIQPAAERNH